MLDKPKSWYYNIYQYIGLRKYLVMENICKNCKHFVPYYTLRITVFSKTARGYCSKSRAAKDGVKTILENHRCDKFEYEEDKQDDVQQNLNYCIRQIQKKLDYIAFILSEK